ncbi:hypothetical protein F4777DRAFT_311550 [Nemania sp. FL0916]|nr:hypothetical protein F4777DRAFT_311550 [Nemania sp. FL0916]
MAPIPVYTNSPITAAKPDGVTPKTDVPDKATPSSTGAPVYTRTHITTTTTTTATGGAAAAQPGATPSLPTPTTYPAAQPTPTASMASASPAPPQPGSVPVSSLPPPPQAGERYQPPTQTRAPAATMPIPHQMAIPSPAAPQPSQQRGTFSAATESSSPYSVPLPSATGGGDTRGFSHPPGYQQNASASQLNQYQRSAMEQPEADDGGDGIWGAAKKLAQQTGERLAAAESEVWKKINRE